LVTLANIQLQYGDEVTVLTLLHSGILAAQLDPDVPVISLRRGWKFNPITMYRFVSVAKKFDIIHVHSYHNLRYVFLASKMWRLKKPIIFHEHFGNIEIDTSVRCHQRWILPQITLAGVSQKICDWAVQKVGMSAARVHLLHNIVQELPYRSDNNPKGPAISIVVCSNIRRPKQIEFAIQVFAALLVSTPATLTIIGQTVDLDYLSEIKQLISEQKLENSINFIHDCTEIQPIVNQFDIALHTPVSESGPLVLIEYLAQGLPFISYKTGEIARMVEAIFPEFILDTFEIAVWLKAIQALLQTDRRSMGQSMRNFYESNFSEISYYQKCKTIYLSAQIS